MEYAQPARTYGQLGRTWPETDHGPLRRTRPEIDLGPLGHARPAGTHGPIPAAVCSDAHNPLGRKAQKAGVGENPTRMRELRQNPRVSIQRIPVVEQEITII